MKSLPSITLYTLSKLFIVIKNAPMTKISSNPSNARCTLWKEELK